MATKILKIIKNNPVKLIVLAFLILSVCEASLMMKNLNRSDSINLLSNKTLSETGVTEYLKTNFNTC